MLRKLPLVKKKQEVLVFSVHFEQTSCIMRRLEIVLPTAILSIIVNNLLGFFTQTKW